MFKEFHKYYISNSSFITPYT